MSLTYQFEFNFLQNLFPITLIHLLTFIIIIFQINILLTFPMIAFSPQQMFWISSFKVQMNLIQMTFIVYYSSISMMDHYKKKSHVIEVNYLQLENQNQFKDLSILMYSPFCFVFILLLQFPKLPLSLLHHYIMFLIAHYIQQCFHS